MQTERQTRQEQIDRQLGRAGWAFGSRRLITEFLVPMPSSIREPGACERRTVEFADYALLDRLGRPLAIVEAKRSSRDPLEGERQAADYAEAIRQKSGSDPFVFLANGNEIWFWHRKLYPPRKVSGFFTEDAVQRCNARLAELLIPYGVSFTAIYFCPHAPEAACDCRKPDIGMWLRARTEFNLDPATCGMIGDKSEDMAFGAAAGFALRILTLTGKGRKTAEALGVHVGPFPLVRKDAWGQIPHVVIEDFNLLMRGIDLWSA